MLITQDTKAREEIMTPKGVMLGMDWLKSECERIKARDSWRNPVIVKVRQGYAIEDKTIKKVMTENRLPKVVPANYKEQVKLHIGWTDEETQMLIELYQSGMRVIDIAKKLSATYKPRTPDGCYYKLSQMNIKLGYNK